MNKSQFIIPKKARNALRNLSKNASNYCLKIHRNSTIAKCTGNKSYHIRTILILLAFICGCNTTSPTRTPSKGAAPPAKDLPPSKRTICEQYYDNQNISRVELQSFWDALEIQETPSQNKEEAKKKILRYCEYE